MRGTYSKQELALPEFTKRTQFPKNGRKQSGTRALWRSSALERLQGKERLHGLAPKSALVAAEPVNEFIVEVRQTQVAKRDVTRRTRRASAVLGCKCISAAVSKDLLAGFGIRFAQRTRGLLASL